MFAFTNNNPRWVSIYVPRPVREDASAYAKMHHQDNPYPNYAGRVFNYSAILLDCVCGWAFSRWCVENGIWHDVNYTDENPADVILDFDGTGMCAVAIVPRFLRSSPASNEGLRISHYRLATEKLQNYLLASFSGEYVTLYGGVLKNDVMGSNHISDFRPLIYEYPAELLPYSMGFIEEHTVKTADEQQTFYNLFDKGK